MGIAPMEKSGTEHDDNSPTVTIDLQRIRRNAQAIIQRTGVPLIAVVKADAYGLGASEVAGAIGDLVEAFYVFHSAEAIAAKLWEISGKRTIALHSDWQDPDSFLDHHIQPVVWTVDRARQLRRARPILSIDTGQQRFACPAEDALQVCQAGDCCEVMTHANTLEQVDKFTAVAAKWPGKIIYMHAAGSALLDQPKTYLNAVRAGLALYEGAISVTVPLVEVHDSDGPAGYTAFIAKRFGIILAGYVNGIRRGACLISGQARNILEVGMQSAFVEIGLDDSIGTGVELFGNLAPVDMKTMAKAWICSPQEVLMHAARAGKRVYLAKTG